MFAVLGQGYVPKQMFKKLKSEKTKRKSETTKAEDFT